MARGWIAGLLTGVVVAGLGLGFVSLVMEPVAPQTETVADAQPEAAPAEAPEMAAPDGQGTETMQEPAAENAAAEQPDADTSAEPAPETIAPAMTDDAELLDAEQVGEPEPDAEPASEPQAAPQPDTTLSADAGDAPMAEPVEVPEAAPVSPEPDEPDAVPAEPETAEPDPAPQDTAAPAIDEPAEAPQTAVPEAVEPLPDETEPELPSVDSADSNSAERLAPPAEPAEAPADLAAPDMAGATPVVPSPPPASAPQLAPAAPDLPDQTPVVPAAPDVAEAPARSAPLPQIVVEAAPDVTPDAAVPPAMVTVSPEADLPPEIDADPAAGVVTDRLPRIGDAPPVVEEAEPAPQPALTRNALPYAPAGDQPKLAVLLIDTGPEDRADLGDLGNLPFPVTVAVDASATDAEQAIAYYRDQGAEVMLAVPLPEGATPTDIDVTMEAYAPLLSQAVAVLAEEDLAFQTLGDGAVQMATNLAEEGLGLVSYPAGLNTGHKAALKAGVHAGLVFRDLDSNGQDAAVIRRFLDNAAFRARSEEEVIVVAHTRLETLQALLEWSLGTRAQSVALVPVSAVLADD